MEKLLTLDQAAAILQVDPETVRNYINSGKLKGVKLAGWTTRVKEENPLWLSLPCSRGLAGMLCNPCQFTN